MTPVHVWALSALFLVGGCGEFELALPAENAAEQEGEPTAEPEIEVHQPPPFEAIFDAASRRLAGAQTKTSRTMRALQVAAGNSPVLLKGGEWSETAGAIFAGGEEIDGAEARSLLDALAHLREELAATAWSGDIDQDLRRARKVAEAEQILARIFIHLADQMGATRPVPPETKHHARKRKLEQLQSSPVPQADIRSLSPGDPAYKRLTKAAKAYEELGRKGGFEPVPGSFKGLKPGSRDPRIGLIRARLAQEDPEVNPKGDTWDEGLTKALIRIRIANQLPVRGMKKGSRRLLDKALRKALSVPVKTRLATLKKNIKRWRESPIRDFPYKVVMNLPDYHGEIWDEGERLHRFKIIIGNTKRRRGRMINATPRLSSLIETIVFNPYWNVPPRIWEEELEPAFQKKAEQNEEGKTFEEVLEEKGYELRGTNPDKPIVRMRPGPRNALGRLKFIFENRDFVYLHDTPAKKLFLKIKRAFSHGCMRVERPRRLAEILLSRDGTWEEVQSKRVFSHYKETAIDLKTPVPIVVEYFTATVDRSGMIHWHDDVYGKDAEAANP